MIGFLDSPALPTLGAVGRYSSTRLASVPRDSCDTAEVTAKSNRQAGVAPVDDCAEDLAFAEGGARSSCSYPGPWRCPGWLHRSHAAPEPFAIVRCGAIWPPVRGVS